MLNVGAREWELESGGRLSSGERLQLAASVIPLQAARAVRTWMAGRHIERRLAQADLPSLQIPTGAEVTQALQDCRSASSITEMYHGLRSFFFASLLARGLALSFEVDLLCVSALLHNVGLTPRYRYQGDDCHCYAVASGRAAYRISERWRWPEVRRWRLREAIVLHMNPAVPGWASTEAYLLQAGVAMDLLGIGLKRLPRPLVCGVYRRYPRGNFAREFAALMRKEAKTHPHGRVALWEQFGFSGAIAADRPGRIDCDGG